MRRINNPSILLAVLLLSTALLTSCVTTKQTSHNGDIPILSQDELIRPYTKLGRITVTRESFVPLYVPDYTLPPDIKAWGFAAVRQEADKMGADAIMLMEVTGRTTSFGMIPSTEYIATGFAIKFK